MREVIPDASRQVPEHGDVRVEERAGRVSVVRRRWGPVRRGLARMLRVEPQKAIHLDALASRAWLLIDGRRTVGEIRDLLASEFPGEPNVGARLGKFLGVMLSERMLRLR
jgi:hypothetical protein